MLGPILYFWEVNTNYESITICCLERSNWSDKEGTLNIPKDSFKLPGKEWEWSDIWHVEKLPEFTDDDGWQYAVDFTSPFHKNLGLFDMVRKRKWIRVYRKKDYP